MLVNIPNPRLSINNRPLLPKPGAGVCFCGGRSANQTVNGVHRLHNGEGLPDGQRGFSRFDAAQKGGDLIAEGGFLCAFVNGQRLGLTVFLQQELRLGRFIQTDVDSGAEAVLNAGVGIFRAEGCRKRIALRHLTAGLHVGAAAV